MNRRGFLQSLLGASIAAQQLDIEKLLWIPGEKTLFIPPPKRMIRVRYCLPRGGYVLVNEDGQACRLPAAEWILT